MGTPPRPIHRPDTGGARPTVRTGPHGRHERDAPEAISGARPRRRRRRRRRRAADAALRRQIIAVLQLCRRREWRHWFYHAYDVNLE